MVDSTASSREGFFGDGYKGETMLCALMTFYNLTRAKIFVAYGQLEQGLSLRMSIFKRAAHGTLSCD